MTTKVRDVIAGEQVLEGAETELSRYTSSPSQWSGAYESMSPDGRRALNLTEVHFERIETLGRRVEAARQQLLATKRQFLDGVLTEGGGARDATA